MNETAFVGREKQLQRLGASLEKAASRNTQVVFVTGEAGAGKTTLVNEFIHRAETADPQLIAAVGECNAQTGQADPYLPFRQVLTSLTAGEEAKNDAKEVDKKKKLDRWRDFAEVSTKTLLMIGPDLVGIFVPGAQIVGRLGMALGLNTDLAKRLSKKIGKGTDAEPAKLDPSLDQEKIFEQYTSVLKALAKDRSLILVLDDLQWADSGSINLLFHLARQLKDARVLLVGTCRPADIALGRDGNRHPLEPVINELKRYYGDIVVDLSQTEAGEGRAFVDALVDAELNLLDGGFREELYAHTDGQPLFTVEILRILQERGSLVKDAQGRWTLGGTLDWQALPARVEGVISERLARLPADLHETLTIGSVQGEVFAAQVVAQVQKVDERDLVRILSRELGKRHLLIQEEGEIRVGSQFLSQYRFGHVLIQQYLYNEISAAERRLLHGNIAAALETLLSGHLDEIALQLASHYEAAGEVEKAAAYWIISGDKAFCAYAYSETITAYSRALSLGAQADLTNEQLTHVYLQLGRAYELDKQFDPALQAYAEMLSAAQARGDLIMELAARSTASTLYSTPTPVADAEKGRSMSEETLAMARRLGDRAAEAKALWNLQLVNLLQNRAAVAIDFGENSLAVAREMGLTQQMAYVLSDLGWAYNLDCQFEKARERMEEGAVLWRQLDNKTMLSNHLNTSLFGLFWMGADEALLATAEESYQLSRSIHEAWNQASARNFQGQVWIDRGEIDKGLSALRESIRLAAAGNMIYEAWYRAMLCKTYGELGALDAGLELYRKYRQADKDIPKASLRVGMLVAYACFEIASSQLEAAELSLAECSADAPPWEAPLRMAQCRLALAQTDGPAACRTAESAVEVARKFNLGQYLPETLFLRGKSLLLSGKPNDARTTLEQARLEAEKLGSSRLRWQILASLADLEPDQDASGSLRSMARKEVDSIAVSITTPGIREAFLRYAAKTLTPVQQVGGNPAGI